MSCFGLLVESFIFCFLFSSRVCAKDSEMKAKPKKRNKTKALDSRRGRWRIAFKRTKTYGGSVVVGVGGIAARRGERMSHPQGFMKSKVKLPLSSSFSYHCAQFLSPPTDCGSRKSANIPHQSPHVTCRASYIFLKTKCNTSSSGATWKTHTHNQQSPCLSVWCWSDEHQLGVGIRFACQSGGGGGRDDGSSSGRL